MRESLTNEYWGVSFYLVGKFSPAKLWEGEGEAKCPSVQSNNWGLIPDFSLKPNSWVNNMTTYAKPMQFFLTKVAAWEIPSWIRINNIVFFIW